MNVLMFVLGSLLSHTAARGHALCSFGDILPLFYGLIRHAVGRGAKLIICPAGGMGVGIWAEAIQAFKPQEATTICRGLNVFQFRRWEREATPVVSFPMLLI